MAMTEKNILSFTFGVLIIVLNVSEIIVIKRRKTKLKTYQQLLLSLAVSDILVGLTSVVNSLLSMLISEQTSRQIFAFMVVFSFSASAINLLVIGIDRLVAVRYPLKHVVLVQKNTIIKVVVVSWIYLGVEMVAFSTLGIFKPAFMAGAVQFYSSALPLLIIVLTFVFLVLYGLICYFAMRAQRNAEKKLTGGLRAGLPHSQPRSVANLAYSVDRGRLETPKTCICHEVAKEDCPGIKLTALSRNRGSCNWQPGEAMARISVIEASFSEIGKKGSKFSKAGKKSKTVCLFCRKQKALFITCSMVVGSFVACTLPFAVETLASAGRRFEVLLIVNSLCNPLVYFFKGLWSERKALRLKEKNDAVSPSVGCKCPEKRNNNHIH